MAKIIPLSDFDINENILAHSPDETLIEHSDLTNEYYNKILSDKNLDNIINTLIFNIDSNYNNLIRQFFDNAIYLHDLGKKNPYFQARKMNNPIFKEYKNETKSTNHSNISAEEYLEYFLSKIESLKLNRKEKYKLQLILYSFAYQISKHHGSLGDFWEYNTEKKEVKNYKAYIDKLEIKNFELFILNKLLFSLIISSDYFATTEYLSKINLSDFGLFDKTLKDKANNRFKLFIDSFPKAERINLLRKKIFDEAENSLLKNINKHIFYLEAPTGSGKTITSVNLALKLMENNKSLNKLFYIFPFNTLVEQTKKVFNDIFESDLNVSVINSITPIEQKKQEDEETNYLMSYVDRLFYHSPAVLTTHVNLFNILFGISKNENYPLWQLANSVVILDEIQSYKTELWWYMVEFFEKYAKYLNMKIIIMSATLPKLDYLLKDNNNFVSLLSENIINEVYSSHYFKDRVKIDLSLLEKGKIDLDFLFEFFHKNRGNYKKILFEFIKKQTAREFFKIIYEQYDNVYELTGDDNKAYRNFIIEKSKEDTPIIIIATQVIEAGIDIDMDLGFKDISTIDSEEQFMGRINRNATKSNSKVYFFDIDDEQAIYKNDDRIEFSIRNKKYSNILLNKHYKIYFQDVLEKVKVKGLSFDVGINTKIENFKNYIKTLNFKKIKEIMTLIDSNTFTLYFPFKIDISKYKNIPEFNDDRVMDFLDNNFLDGQKVWDYYLNLTEIKNFTEYNVKKTFINSLMQFFTFNIIKYDSQSRPCIGENIGGIYFIEDYEDFIIEGKFDRIAFQEKCNSLFL